MKSKIARRLGVSQAPVRDAVKRLVHQGIVSHVPRRGNYLTEVSEEDAEQARQVRTALEWLAARLAVAHVSERCRAFSGPRILRSLCCELLIQVFVADFLRSPVTES